VPRQPGDLGGELGEGSPARRAELRLAVRQERDLLPHTLRVSLRDARQPLELGERQAERLPHVPDRAPRAIGREARDERRVLVPVALGDGDDQLLADVSREVEVDVWHGVELPVEEPAEREVGSHRIDV